LTVTCSSRVGHVLVQRVSPGFLRANRVGGLNDEQILSWEDDCEIIRCLRERSRGRKYARRDVRDNDMHGPATVIKGNVARRVTACTHCARNGPSA